MMEEAEVLEELSQTINDIYIFQNLNKSQLCYKPDKRTQSLNKQRQKIHTKTHSILNLIPPGLNTKNNQPLIPLIEKYLHKHTIHLQIPETLIITPSKQTFFFSNNGLIQCIVGDSAIPGFFDACSKFPYSPYKYPRFVFKSDSGLQLLFFESVALERVKILQSFSLQRFVHPKGNQVGLIRIHWSQGKLTRMYSITNILKAPKQEPIFQDIKRRPQNRKDILDYVKRVKTSLFNFDGGLYSEEVSGDLSLIKKPSLSQNALLQPEPDSRICESGDRPYLIDEKSSHLWDVKTLTGSHTQSHQMIEQIVQLLNATSSPEIRVNELVLDFLRDSTKKLFIIRIAQSMTSRKNDKKSMFQTRSREHIKTLARRIQVKGCNKNFESMLKSAKLSSKKLYFERLVLHGLKPHIKPQKPSVIELQAMDLAQKIASNQPLERQRPQLSHYSSLSPLRKKISLTLAQKHTLSRFGTLMVRSTKAHFKQLGFQEKYGQAVVNKILVEFYNCIINSQVLGQFCSNLGQGHVILLARQYRRLVKSKNGQSNSKAVERCKIPKDFGEYLRILKTALSCVVLGQRDKGQFLKEMNYILNDLSSNTMRIF